MLIIHANSFLRGEFFSHDYQIRIENGIISEIGSSLSEINGEQILDLDNEYLLPGFVDVHTHAYSKHDTMYGENDIREMSRAFHDLGVAAFLPTTMSTDMISTSEAIHNVHNIMKHPEKKGAFVAGAHMEAPFLSAEKRGCQDPSYFYNPDWKTFLDFCGNEPEAVKLITIAPELPGSDQFIKEAKSRGIHVSAGHTNADAEILHHAADCGLDHITHTFNAHPSLHHRKPGTIGAALTDDRVYCEMICDGFHLHPDVIRLIIRAKGADKALAITDSMEAAGTCDGEYMLGGYKVFVRNGQATLENGTIAGSTLTMRKAFTNLISWGISVEDAIKVTTLTPAQSVGLTQFGKIDIGCNGTLTRWDKNWNFLGVI